MLRSALWSKCGLTQPTGVSLESSLGLYPQLIMVTAACCYNQNLVANTEISAALFLFSIFFITEEQHNTRIQYTLIKAPFAYWL